MDRAGAVVGRDGAPRKVRGFGGGAALENEQGAAAPNRVRGEAGVGEHGREAEDPFVERPRAVHVVDVERRFEHAV